MAEKIIHRAKNLRDDGAVSALCFASKRPINLVQSSWTLRDDAVTCARCLQLMEQLDLAAQARLRQEADRG